MKNSKEDLVNAILFFGKLYGQEENYKALMESYNGGLPKIVEMITYEMFLRKFSYFKCAHEEWERYKIIYDYATELKENGFVTFDTK